MMLRWLNPFVWWRRLQRRMDRTLLFPAFIELGASQSDFALAMAYHMKLDLAWQVPDWEFTAWEREFLDGLFPPP